MAGIYVKYRTMNQDGLINPNQPAAPPAESIDPNDHWGGDDDCDEDPGVPAPAAMPTPSAPRAPFAPPVPPTDDDHNDDIPF